MEEQQDQRNLSKILERSCKPIRMQLDLPGKREDKQDTRHRLHRVDQEGFIQPCIEVDARREEYIQ